MKLALDHHYSPLIAESLRKRGHDVVCAIEAGWEAEDDEPLLVLCVTEERALLTNDVADFSVLARQWQLEGQPHYGLIFTSDATMPRTRHNVRRFVEALDAVMRAHPTKVGLKDRIHWLAPP